MSVQCIMLWFLELISICMIQEMNHDTTKSSDWYGYHGLPSRAGHLHKQYITRINKMSWTQHLHDLPRIIYLYLCTIFDQRRLDIIDQLEYPWSPYSSWSIMVKYPTTCGIFYYP